ncbi:MAG: hypothetical protein JXN64_09845 [Spirochaetes bacterium]|nr:hypothetical protein [Spirochaetota bacterium]
MELRIYCRKGNCQNILRKEIKLGDRIKDVLYVHGWIEDPVIGPVCPGCQISEHEIHIDYLSNKKRKSA